MQKNSWENIVCLQMEMKIKVSFFVFYKLLNIKVSKHLFILSIEFHYIYSAFAS